MKNNNFHPEDHTFVVCAFNESPFLEECVQSLQAQSIHSKILIATSTPNQLITRIAEEYRLKVFINAGESGIAGDWNYAVSCAETPLITIAHQDDVYEPCYTEAMLSMMNAAKNPILFSSAYAELRNGKKTTDAKLLSIKRTMLLPMRAFPRSVLARRLSISLGNPICCPSVTYISDIIKKNPFEPGLKSNLDWQQWEKLSKLKGSFLYSSEILMCHRIHADSETSRIIGENSRTLEDLEMFRKFWPEKTAQFLSRMYANSEKSNST